jgi:hypothetical protein
MKKTAAKRERLFGVNYFLTWPQNDTSKEALYKNVEKMFGDLYKFMIVGREMHKDGNPHLHAVIVMKKKKSTSFVQLDEVRRFRLMFINVYTDFLNSWRERGATINAHATFRTA